MKQRSFFAALLLLSLVTPKTAITSGKCQMNQTNLSSSVLSGGYKVYN